MIALADTVVLAERAGRRHDSEVQRTSERSSMRVGKSSELDAPGSPKRTFRQKMDGRFFAGRRIEASFYAGKQRFKRSGVGDDVEGDTDEAEKKRLDNFATWLMTEGD